MNILAVNGSPRREKGRTEEVIAAVLEAARSRGAQTDTLYLVDEEPEYCSHCGHNCFSDGRCLREPAATERSKRIQDAEALILGAPVYCWQPNALTCMLFDKFRIVGGTWRDSSAPGIPAVGIAVAGGTGTGVFTALQSMYAWMCAWRFTPVAPVPVTRYNMAAVLRDADGIAASLMEERQPVFDEIWNQMLLYDRLPFMNYGRIDEYRWLAHSMADCLEERKTDTEVIDRVRQVLGRADDEKDRGNEERRAELVLEAFETAYPLCRG